MSRSWFDMEVGKILSNQALLADAVSTIYDHALFGEDKKTLLRVRDIYPPDFLDLAIGGYPDYLDEEGES